MLRPVDILDSERVDVTDGTFFRLERAIISGRFIALLRLGPPCASFSVAVTPPRRGPS